VASGGDKTVRFPALSLLSALGGWIDNEYTGTEHKKHDELMRKRNEWREGNFSFT